MPNVDSLTQQVDPLVMRAQTRVGTVLRDKWRLDSLLGVGGMAAVYAATRVTTGQRVAVKVLHPELSLHPDMRSRFKREGYAANAIDHEGCVKVLYDDVAEDGSLFLVMELLDGETLEDRQNRLGGRLAEDEVLSIADHVLDVLAAAHARGVLHRDLKPSNLFMTRDGRTKVLDLGLARLKELSTKSSATKTGVTMGTPAFMPPEQARGAWSEVDARSDVWAVGATMFALLSGTFVHGDGTQNEQLVAAMTKHASPLATAVPGVAAAVAHVVDRALTFDKNDRWPSASDMQAAVRHAVANRGGPAYPLPPTAAANRPASLAGGGTLVRIVGLLKRTIPRAQRRTAVLVMGLAMLIGAGAAVAVTAKTRAAPAPSATSSSSAIAAPRPTTLADLPLPASSVPEAIVEYKAGIQLLRDDSVANATSRFDHAAMLDQSMALAHLRTAIAAGLCGEAERAKAAFARAAALRAQLGERDVVLLEAVEPILARTARSPATAVERLGAAHERFPLDEEFLALAAFLVVDDSARGPAVAMRATELDPEDASAWEALGRSEAMAGDLDAGRRALEKCASLSVNSSDCFEWLARLDGEAGRCADMEIEARVAADRNPKYGTRVLASAMAALDRPTPSIREVIARQVSSLPVEEQATRQGFYDARLAILGGRFDAALRRLDQARLALPLSERSVLDWSGRLATTRIELLRETGDDRAASAAARDLSDRLTIVAQGAADLGPHFWTRRIAGIPLDPSRSDWVEKQLAAGAQGSAVWVQAWAMSALTRADGEGAIAALADDRRLAAPRGGESMGGFVVDLQGPAGNAYLLAGKPDEAKRYLESSVASCTLFEGPFDHVHAQLDLGLALEQTGDTAGACDAFGAVLARWGKARPRSVTADAARAGVKRLGCGK